MRKITHQQNKKPSPLDTHFQVAQQTNTGFRIFLLTAIAQPTDVLSVCVGSPLHVAAHVAYAGASVHAQEACDSRSSWCYRSRPFSSCPPAMSRIASSTTNFSESARAARSEPRTSFSALLSVALALKRSSCAHRHKSHTTHMVHADLSGLRDVGSVRARNADVRVRASERPHLDGPLSNHLLAAGLIVHERASSPHARRVRTRLVGAEVPLDGAAPAKPAPIAHGVEPPSRQA